MDELRHSERKFIGYLPDRHRARVQCFYHPISLSVFLEKNPEIILMSYIKGSTSEKCF
jgi:hypothetical protein